jgi:hypothetical protein
MPKAARATALPKPIKQCTVHSFANVHGDGMRAVFYAHEDSPAWGVLKGERVISSPVLYVDMEQRVFETRNTIYSFVLPTR